MSATWPKRIVLFIVALVCAPFVATGIFRLLPGYSDAQLLIPVGFAAIAAIAIERFQPSLRPMWIGLALGTALHLVFLVWLFASSGGMSVGSSVVIAIDRTTRGCSRPHHAVALGGMIEVMRGADAAAEPQGRWADQRREEVLGRA